MLIEDRINAERETRPQLIGLPSVDTSARRAGELADSRPVLPLERLEEISRKSRGANERPEIDTFREVAACHTGKCATKGALAERSRVRKYPAGRDPSHRPHLPRRRML